MPWSAPGAFGRRSCSRTSAPIRREAGSWSSTAARTASPVLFAHIFTTIPFASSFVITFSIAKIDGGAFGTELKASLPQALGDWGYLDRIKLTLRRKYDYKGKELSYFNANCPTPKGTPTASFPLALADFDFGEDGKIGVSVTKSCRVKG